MTAACLHKYVPAVALLLAGCAALPSAEAPPGTAVESRAYAEKLDLGGRISVRYESGDRQEALHGGFLWVQDAGRTHVTLLSPLGQTIALIDVGPAGATLTQAGQPPRTAPDVDALVADTLGWPLPISGMRDWLQGFAVDTDGKRFVARDSTSEVTTRDGWRIRYDGWQDARPKRIDLRRQTVQAGDVSIRLVIDARQ